MPPKKTDKQRGRHIAEYYKSRIPAQYRTSTSVVPVISHAYRDIQRWVDETADLRVALESKEDIINAKERELAARENALQWKEYEYSYKFAYWDDMLAKKAAEAAAPPAPPAPVVKPKKPASKLVDYGGWIQQQQKKNKK
jgi:hypothetical protein